MPIYSLPSDRVTAWTPNVLQGIVGGIPEYTQETDAFFDFGGVVGTGGDASTNSGAIYAAVNAVSNGTSIVLPPGIIKTNGIPIPNGKSFREVVGSGMYGANMTTLREYGVGLSMGQGTVWGDTYNVNAVVTAGLTKGSTSFTVNQPYWPVDGTNQVFTAGKLVFLQIPNEGNTPVWSPINNAVLRSVILKVVSYNNTTKVVTFFPPLAFTPGITTGVKLIESQYQTQNRVGFRNFVLDGTYSSTMANGITIGGGSEQWVKRVKILGYNNRGIEVGQTVNTEVKQCDVVGAVGNNKTGILVGRCTGMLANFNLTTAFQINDGTSGSIYGYNRVLQIFNSNHEPHNSFNLYEGNDVEDYFQPDGYHGSDSDQTYFRNWSRKGVLISVKRFVRRPNLIGNISGTPGNTYYDMQYPNKWGLPNISNENKSGTMDISAGNYPEDWDPVNKASREWAATLTTGQGTTSGTLTIAPGDRASFKLHYNEAPTFQLYFSSINTASTYNDTTGVLTYTANAFAIPASSDGAAVIIRPGVGGFQRQDAESFTTSLRKQNYHVFLLPTTGGLYPGEGLAAGEVLPSSLMYASKPTEFSTLAFPSYDAKNAATAAATALAGRNPASFYEEEGYFPDDIPPEPEIPAFYLDPETRSAIDQQEVALTALATGFPEPSYQWKKNGVALINDGNISGVDTYALTFSPVTLSDSGTYTCVASNSQGTDTSAAGVFTVNPIGYEDGGRPFAPTNFVYAPQ